MSYIGGRVQTYTPTITRSSSNPTLGTGNTAVGRVFILYTHTALGACPLASTGSGGALQITATYEIA